MPLPSTGAGEGSVWHRYYPPGSFSGHRSGFDCILKVLAKSGTIGQVGILCIDSMAPDKEERSSEVPMTAPTTTRVQQHTKARVNERIREQIERNITYYACIDGKEDGALDARLRELDHEWDIERLLEANAASFFLLGLVLGIFVHAVWFLLPVAVAAFLLQHAIQGWCPPVPVFRRLGIRAAAEIDAERYALKVLRGDFDEALRTAYGSCADRAARLLESVER